MFDNIWFSTYLVLEVEILRLILICGILVPSEFGKFGPGLWCAEKTTNVFCQEVEGTMVRCLKNVSSATGKLHHLFLQQHQLAAELTACMAVFPGFSEPTATVT